jgi:hypothetical protein
MGVVNAGWADSGLHPETFWLGYAAGTAAGWHPGAAPEAEESTTNFYRLFYGWNAVDVDRLYHLMSGQAQFWLDTWETGPSNSRKPIWGNSNRIYNPRQPVHDQFIPLPPPPGVDLKYDSTWSKDNDKRLQLAADFLGQNDELLNLLRQNMQRADFNRHNLEVCLSVAQVIRHNLTMLAALGRMDKLLADAQAAAAKDHPQQAVAAVNEALKLARDIRRERNTTLRDLTATWYKSWYPRVPAANGRTVLHEHDDVKDHPADRTVDLSYMIQREILLPFGEWVGQVRTARTQYAQAHNLPLNNDTFDWKDINEAR